MLKIATFDGGLTINSDILTIRAEEFKESCHRELMLEFLIMVDVSEARSSSVNLCILRHRQKVVYKQLTD
jgi:hypothetical protein